MKYPALICVSGLSLHKFHILETRVNIFGNKKHRCLRCKRTLNPQEYEEYLNQVAEWREEKPR